MTLLLENTTAPPCSAVLMKVTKEWPEKITLVLCKVQIAPADD